MFFVTILRGANLSESEAEQDEEHNVTELPQVYSGRGNMASQQSAVRLTEVRMRTKLIYFFIFFSLNSVWVVLKISLCCSQIGPRMTLRLMKIQEGMGEGNVIYHSMSKRILFLIFSLAYAGVYMMKKTVWILWFLSKKKKVNAYWYTLNLQNFIYRLEAGKNCS